jgi:hypothetical protein
MPTLEALMVIKRKAKACPWRFSGVTWCKALMTMGCTEPRNKPNTIEHRPMVKALPANG